jgi:hypothetical protein
MLCLKCLNDPCKCEENKENPNLLKSQKCRICGGSGWEKYMASLDPTDPANYTGPCRACGGKGET